MPRGIGAFVEPSPYAVWPVNPHQRKQLEERLRALPKGEQDRLFKRAAELRRDDQDRAKREHRSFADLDEPRPGGARRKNDPVRMYVLKLLAKELAEGQASGGRGADSASRGAAGDVRTGIAVFVGKRRCLVRPLDAAGERPALVAEDDSVECRLPADLAGRQQSELCVGDRVSFREPDDERRESPEIVGVLARRTVLARRDPRTGQRRAIVANVDAVVMVVSVVSPPLHPRLIDRYLIAIEDSWVEGTSGRHADDPDPAAAVIALNKTDLLRGLSPEARADERAKLDPYRALGIPIIECSATDVAKGESGIDALRAHLAGRVVALVGHSGVGKTSLANALDPALGAAVGSIGSAANRGRHTTTSSQLHEILAVEGGAAHEPFWVIDTPGIRFFGLEELTAAELRDAFPELRRLRRGCRFNDCTHTHEPGCAVLEAVEAGELHPARYDTYTRLLEDIERGFKPPTERIRPIAQEDADG